MASPSVENSRSSAGAALAAPAFARKKRAVPSTIASCAAFRRFGLRVPGCGSPASTPTLAAIFETSFPAAGSYDRAAGCTERQITSGRLLPLGQSLLIGCARVERALLQ